MLTDKTTQLLEEQINKELYSAYLYLEMSCYYEEENLSGFANWFHVQAQEEMAHAMLFLKFLQNNGKHVAFEDVKAEKQQYHNFLEPLEKQYSHELTVTESIHTIYAAAFEDKDFRTMQFLDWFIKEQNEEEKNADDLIKKYKLFGQDAKGLYLLDNELAGRVYNAPSLVLD